MYCDARKSNREKIRPRVAEKKAPFWNDPLINCQNSRKADTAQTDQALLFLFEAVGVQKLEHCGSVSPEVVQGENFRPSIGTPPSSRGDYATPRVIFPVHYSTFISINFCIKYFLDVPSTGSLSSRCNREKDNDRK